MAYEPLGDAAHIQRVVCGVDRSPESRVAVEQARVVADPDAQMTAVSVWNPAFAFRAGIHVSAVHDELRADAVKAIERATSATSGVDSLLVEGGETASLISAISKLEADLVAVGSHGDSRVAGILLGSVATAMVHHAPCSVLVARNGRPDGGRILHASDGSPESLVAARVAGRIAGRCDRPVTSLHVRDPGLDPRPLRAEGGIFAAEGATDHLLESREGSAARGLAERAEEVGASLIVMGSRGKTGIAALGSVSERVAHKAKCSVLVIRPPARPRLEEQSPDAHAESQRHSRFE